MDMSDIKNSYNKLRGSSLLSSNKLYVGPDHMLSISSNFFSEKYLRFYFKDIQAIITRKTSKGKILNICFSVILTIFLFFAIILSRGWSVFFGVLSSICLILLIINILKGPTSVSYIQTSIQTFRLSALRRIKSAQKAITQLKTLIEETQGVLTGDLIERLRNREKSEDTYIPFYKVLKHENGIFHLSVFSLLALNAIFISIDIFYQNIVLSLISSTVVMAIVVLLIIALIKQKNSDLYKSIKVVTWSIIVYLCIITISSYAITLFVTIQNQEVAYNQLELLKKISALSPLSNSWLLGLSIFSLAYSSSIGISGILFIMKFQREYRSMQEQGPVKNESIPLGLNHE
jgi:hypothetical protein